MELVKNSLSLYIVLNGTLTTKWPKPVLIGQQLVDNPATQRPKACTHIVGDKVILDQRCKFPFVLIRDIHSHAWHFFFAFRIIPLLCLLFTEGTMRKVTEGRGWWAIFCVDLPQPHPFSNVPSLTTHHSVPWFSAILVVTIHLPPQWSSIRPVPCNFESCLFQFGLKVLLWISIPVIVVSLTKQLQSRNLKFRYS